MKGKRTKPESIDAYIAAFPKEVGAILRKIRATIRKAAPGAEEAISYQIPSFKLNGRYMIYFAGFENHVSLYPAPREKVDFEKALAPYRSGRATVKFLLGEPIPFGLITKIVRLKVKENAEWAKARQKKK